jgi:hypothetical protein
MAPVPYDQFEGDPCDEDAGGIIGQVSGPTSFSEYEGADWPGCRRNVTAPPQNIPDPLARRKG